MLQSEQLAHDHLGSLERLTGAAQIPEKLRALVNMGFKSGRSVVQEIPLKKWAEIYCDLGSLERVTGAAEGLRERLGLN